MNVVPVRDNLPKDVTFFIGPVGSPPEFKDIYQKAVEQYDVGNTVALDEILEFQIKSLREIVEDSDAKPSPLRKLIGSLINREIGILPAFVSKGYMRRTWTPIVTIHLDQLTEVDGSPIGHLLTKRYGEVIAAMLGQTFKAEWIYTSWAYFDTPTEIERKFDQG